MSVLEGDMDGMESKAHGESTLMIFPFNDARRKFSTPHVELINTRYNVVLRLNSSDCAIDILR